MLHVRTQVRDAVIERLRSIDALACVGPYGRSARSFQRNEIPAGIVRVSEISSPVGKIRPRTQRRDLTVTVDLLASLDADDVDAVLDDLAVSVEEILSDPHDLSIGALLDWRLASSVPGVADLGEAVYGRLTLSYTASVSTTEGAPTTNIHA